jgi:hypothetical protein
MNTGPLPALSLGPVSAATRDWAFRPIQFAAASRPRAPCWPAAAIFAAVSAAWLVNSKEWGFDEVQALVAVCTGGLVATAVLTVGWASEPEDLERWVLRALAATMTSVLPLVR